MKRNTITIIELIIILCVIVVALGLWNYKKILPHHVGHIGGHNCPNCGSSDTKLTGIINDGGSDLPLACNKCGWYWLCIEGFDEQCPKCGHIGIKYRKPLDDPPTVPDKTCPNCGWYENFPTPVP